MDTSKEYIAMANCGEIQETWIPKIDDFVIQYQSTGGALSFAHARSYDILYGIITQGGATKGNKIWLPRQGQIQEMLNYTLGMLTTGNFYEFCHNKMGLRMSNTNVYNFTSMEQLWLAFYMKEKHKKEWDEVNWVA